MQEDGVLDLSQSRLLDPDFTIKDLAYEVALLILRNPRLIFVAVCRVADKANMGRCAFAVNGVMLVCKELPWPEMTVMHPVKNLELLV